MDGRTLSRDLRQLLQEQVSGTWMDAKTSYEYLFKAAEEFVSQTQVLTNVATLTNTSGSGSVPLPADFMEIAYFSTQNQPFIKANDGTNDTFIYHREYGPVLLANQSAITGFPSTFSITDYPAEANITGTTSAAGVTTLAETRLTDGTATFVTDGVKVGDAVHNETDGSSGYVLEVVSETELLTALFDGTNTEWESGDTYIVIPQGKFQLILDPPTTTALTISVNYVQRPAPVFSDFRSYRIPIGYKQALIFYAAWMYKNRDREPQYAEYEHKYFEDQVRKAKAQFTGSLRRSSFRVNMIKRGQDSGSVR